MISDKMHCNEKGSTFKLFCVKYLTQLWLYHMKILNFELEHKTPVFRITKHDEGQDAQEIEQKWR